MYSRFVFLRFGCWVVDHAVSQGRITNLNDIPVLAPYFFVEPDYTSDEARKMLKSIDDISYGMFAV